MIVCAIEATTKASTTIRDAAMVQTMLSAQEMFHGGFVSTLEVKEQLRLS
jgi:hypothetical protein